MNSTSLKMSFRRGFQILLAVLFAMGLFQVPALAAELAGVSMPDSMTIGGKYCSIVGMGIRKKLIIKVYVAGLYMAQPSTDVMTIIDSDQPKGMIMHFVYKEVEAEKLREAWQDGFEANTSQASADLKKRMAEFNSLFSEAALSGDEISLTYDPAQGTKVVIKGQDKGTIKGADFAQALFAVWFGEKPADKGLKKSILSSTH